MSEATGSGRKKELDILIAYKWREDSCSRNPYTSGNPVSQKRCITNFTICLNSSRKGNIASDKIGFLHNIFLFSP